MCDMCRVNDTGRRLVAPAVQKNLKAYVPGLLRQEFISPDAADYLLGYADSTLPRIARPSAHEFRDYKWRPDASFRPPAIRFDGEEPFRGVRVARIQVNDAADGEDDPPPLADVAAEDDPMPGPVLLHPG